MMIFLLFTENKKNEMEGDKPAIGRGAKLAALYAERERKKAEGKHGFLCPTLCCKSRLFIPDLNLTIPDPRSRVKKRFRI
jgi:hypothetical protein